MLALHWVLMERISAWAQQTRSAMLESHVILLKENKERRKLEKILALIWWWCMEHHTHTHTHTRALHHWDTCQSRGIKLFEDLSWLALNITVQARQQLNWSMVAYVYANKIYTGIIRRCTVTWCYIMQLLATGTCTIRPRPNGPRRPTRPT